MSILAPEEINIGLKILVSVTETLSSEVQTQLKPALIQLNDQLNNQLNNRKRTLELVQEALSQLCVDVKYLIFDLEATRRERDEFKYQLEK